jgi:anti-anti-sigma regulatory factor
MTSGGQEDKFEIAGDLTIKNATDIKDRLLSRFDTHDHVILQLDDEANVDLSFLQLIESARQYATKKGGSLSLEKPANQNLKNVLQRAGFLEKIAAADKEFWFHQENL